MNPLVQFDSPRTFENADGSKIQGSTLAKLGPGLIAKRDPASPAPGQPSYLVLDLPPSLTVSDNLEVSGSVTIGGALRVTGGSTLSTLATTGAATIGGLLSAHAGLSVTGNTTTSGTVGSGGAATLGSTLAVGGATTVAGPVFATGLNSSGAATVATTLRVAGQATVADLLHAGGGVTVNGGITSNATLEVSSSATIGTTLSIGNATTIGRSLSVATSATVGSSLSVSGATTLGGTAAITGAATLASTLSVTGAATISGLLTASAGMNMPSGQILTINGTAAGGTRVGAFTQPNVGAIVPGVTYAGVRPPVGAQALISKGSKYWGLYSVDASLASTVDLKCIRAIDAAPAGAVAADSDLMFYTGDLSQVLYSDSTNFASDPVDAGTALRRVSAAVVTLLGGTIPD